jgi:uncharacterized protein (TIGR00369 family)
MMTGEAYAGVWARLSGAELLQQVADGHLPVPPHAAQIGLSIARVQPGRVELDWEPTSAVRNLAGDVHGGYLAMVLDDAAGLACASLGERFRPMLTLSLHIDFLRPVRSGVRYTATGVVIHPGRSRLVAEADITGPEGQRLARGSGSFSPNLAFDPVSS